MPCNNIFAYEVTSSPKDMNHSGNERLICHHKSYTSNTTRKQEKKTALTWRKKAYFSKVAKLMTMLGERRSHFVDI